MKNVEIVSMKYTSDYLLKNAIAVATLSGTVLLEAIEKKKPILLFSEFHPLVHDDDVLKCFSYSRLVENIQLLKNGYKPKYDKTTSILNRYLSGAVVHFFYNMIRIVKQYELK